MMVKTIDNTEDIMDSRDFVERIEELESEVEDTDNNTSDEIAESQKELAILKSVAEQASASPDWGEGEPLIRETYFTEHIEQMIDDCYEMPKQINSGDWPWRHMTMDIEAAAEECKPDYIDVDFDGVEYLIRG